MRDTLKLLSFPSIDGRELKLKFDIVSGIAILTESIDGECESVCLGQTEIETMIFYMKQVLKK